MIDKNGSFNTGFRIDGNENGNLYFFIFSCLFLNLRIFAVSAHQHPYPGADWIGYHGQGQKDDV